MGKVYIACVQRVMVRGTETRSIRLDDIPVQIYLFISQFKLHAKDAGNEK